MRDDCISGRESKVFELRSEKPRSGSRNEEVQCLCEMGDFRGVNLEDAVSEVFLESESHLNRVRMNSHRILDTAVRPRAELAA